MAQLGRSGVPVVHVDNERYEVTLSVINETGSADLDQDALVNLLHDTLVGKGYKLDHLGVRLDSDSTARCIAALQVAEV